MDYQVELENLKLVSPQAASLAQRIQEIDGALQRGEITVQDRQFFLEQVRDVEIAQQLAGDENAVRMAVAIVGAAITVFG
jgi:hypothetical protein